MRGSIVTATSMTTDCRSTRRAPATGATTTKAGKTPASPSSTAMARTPSSRSPPANCRATSSRQNADGRASSSKPSTILPPPPAYATRQTASPRSSTSASGGRLRVPTIWVSTETSDRSKQSHPTQDTSSGPVRCHQIGRVPSLTVCWKTTCGAAGASAHSRRRHAAYNPLSYQLGSVWPHDNAIIANGLARYGHSQQAAQIARGLLDAAQRFQHTRLPEVFAGLARDQGSFPVQYLGANVPQAWASGSIIHLITTLTGIHPDAPSNRLIVSPALPDWLPEVDPHQSANRRREGRPSPHPRPRRGHAGPRPARGDHLRDRASVITHRQTGQPQPTVSRAR